MLSDAGTAPVPSRIRLQRICVYCGSASGGDPLYGAAARRFGALLAAEGIELVYGGGGRGLMGILARAVVDGGGRVTGIIPDFLTDRDAMLADAHEQIVVPDMHTRKRLMFERADAFVALPGGIGTLEELVEQLTWVQLERHTKPVLIADLGGFWRPLLALFDHMGTNGFINPDTAIRHLVADDVEAILPMLRDAADLAARSGWRKDALDDRL